MDPCVDKTYPQHWRLLNKWLKKWRASAMAGEAPGALGVHGRCPCHSLGRDSPWGFPRSGVILQTSEEYTQREREKRGNISQKERTIYAKSRSDQVCGTFEELKVYWSWSEGVTTLRGQINHGSVYASIMKRLQDKVCKSAGSFFLPCVMVQRWANQGW